MAAVPVHPCRGGIYITSLHRTFRSRDRRCRLHPHAVQEECYGGVRLDRRHGPHFSSLLRHYWSFVSRWCVLIAGGAAACAAAGCLSWAAVVAVVLLSLWLWSPQGVLPGTRTAHLFVREALRTMRASAWRPALPTHLLVNHRFPPVPPSLRPISCGGVGIFSPLFRTPDRRKSGFFASRSLRFLARSHFVRPLHAAPNLIFTCAVCTSAFALHCINN